MTARWVPFTTLLILARCGGPSFTATLTAASPAPVPDVFACARSQLGVLGYRQSSIDVDEHRVTGRRVDETVRRPDTRFRRVIDQLEIEVGPQSTGETGLTIQAKTLGEYVGQVGFIEQLEEASDGVQAAAQSIVQACGR